MDCSILKISIITISFNSERTIENTIISVLNQKYANVEYILIDGGSTDSTLDIIKKYANNISFWISEPDKGISDAFNKGLSRATGDIIGIINSDDTYAEDTFQRVAEAFMENSAADFVFGDMLFLDEKGISLHRQIGDEHYAETIHFDMPSVPHPTVFLRRKVYDDAGLFDTSYKTAMDYELLLRIHQKGYKGFYLPSVLACMQLGGESDNNYAGGYREVMLASIKYGYNKYPAYLRFCYKCLKTFTRKILSRYGLGKIVKTFRTVAGKRYRY